MLKLKKKHLIVLMFLFVAFMFIGMKNVDATTFENGGQTVIVDNATDLNYALNGLGDYADVTEIKLGEDITDDRTYSVCVNGRNLTLDLNGNTLSFPSYFMSINYSREYNTNSYVYNGSFTLKDSSNGQNGKLETKYIYVNSNIALPDEEKATTAKNYNLTFDGGTYVFKYNYPVITLYSANDSYTNGYNITLNTTIEKGTFELVYSEGSLFGAQHPNADNDVVLKFNLKQLTLKGYKVRIGGNRLLNKTIGEMVPTSTRIYHNVSDGAGGYVEEEITDRTTTVGNIYGAYEPLTSENVGYIKLVSGGLGVSNVSLSETYGYSTAPEKDITITNGDSNAIQIKNVTVADADKFEIVGATQPTISAGATNTDFKVKAKTGLNAGTYTTTITVTDMSDNTYTANVTLVVEQKQVDDLGAGFDGSWTYGETALEPHIYGVSSLGADEYKVEYAKKGTEDWSTTKPTTAGDYTIRISITGSNYKSATASSDFKILQTEKVVRIVANSSNHVYDGNAYTDSGYKVYFDGTEVTDGKLLYDDTVNATITGSVTDVVDNSANNNTFDDVVITHLASYKNIELVNGTISITPITTPIVVKANNDTKPYDGSALTNAGFTYTNDVLLPGDILTATVTGSQKYVGTSNNTVSNVKVMRGDKDITSNYTFGTHENGTLTVTVAEQNVSIGNLNVRVGSSISNDTLLDEVSGAIGTISFEKASGVGTYDASNGFTAGTTTGTANMKVNVTAKDVNADGTNEYNSTSKTFTISVVEKEEVTISGLTDNETFTYDGNTKTPTGTITVSDNKVPVSELEVLYEGTGSTTYSSATAPKNAGTYKVTYKVSDSNINYVGTKTYTFTIKKAQLKKVYLFKDSFVYTGEEITTSPNYYNGSLLQLNSGSILYATNVGNYTITVSLKDKDNYEWKDGTTTDLTLNWSITKATPEYTVPTNLTAVKGQLLSEITLPTGFTWNIPAMILNTAGTQTFKATFTPTDTANYETITNIDIKVKVKDLFDVTTSITGGNGAITASKTDVLEGSTVTITFTPATGYMIDKVLVNGTEKTVTGNKLDLTVNENKTVEVSYKKIPFTITVESVEGATVDPNGTVTVNYGDNKDFTITANTGYKLVKVLVNNVEKTLDGNTLKLTNITANMNIKVVVEKIVYEVIEGAEQTYTITEDTEARFRIDANYRLFNNKVYVDDVLVDIENYTSESGSTIITLKQSYVDTLAVGEHTLRVAFIDGGEATTTFTVAEKEEEINNDNNNDNNDNNNNDNISSETEKEDKIDNSSNPKTGDNIMLYVAIAGMSILGLGVTVIVAKNKRSN